MDSQPAAQRLKQSTPFALGICLWKFEAYCWELAGNCVPLPMVKPIARRTYFRECSRVTRPAGTIIKEILYWKATALHYVPDRPVCLT